MKHRYTSYHSKIKLDELEHTLEWAKNQWGICNTTSKSLIEIGHLNPSTKGIWGCKLKILGNRRGSHKPIFRRGKFRRIKIRWMFNNEDDLAAFLLLSNIIDLNQGK